MHLHLSGFSETRALLEYGAWQDLNCNQTSCVHCDMADDSVCRFDPRWRQQRNTSFLAFCREEQQLRGIYEVPCAPPPTTWPTTVTLSYAWKSFVDSVLDDNIEAYLLAKAKEGPTLAIFSAGAHHFAQHLEHTNQHQSHVKDSWVPPQSWMDTWVHGTLRMMARLARLNKQQRVCCVWKTNNVGSRLAVGEWHHPSVEGGAHDYMNRVSVSMARELGVPTVDLTQLTVAMTRNASQKEGALTGMSDTDYYHGYNHGILWQRTRGEVLEACKRTWGSERNARRRRL